MPAPLSGGCLCGAIRYTVSVPITELRACHCRDCQKSTGGAGTVNAVIPSAAMQIGKGTPKRYSVTADSGRTLHRFFCGDCGSPLFSRRELTPENTALRIGTLDDSSGMKITANIWTRSARPWAYIDPASQQFPGQPDAPAKK
jgi:hypothetical protein